MPRRKQQVYRRQVKEPPVSTQRDIDTMLTPPTARLFPNMPGLPVRLSTVRMASGPGKSRVQWVAATKDLRETAAKSRRRVQKIVAMSSLLAAASGVLGFLIISTERRSVDFFASWLHIALLLSSVLQVPLVILYWRSSQQYLDLGRKALRYGAQAMHTRTAVCACITECAFNLVFLPTLYDCCALFYITSAYNRVCVVESLYSLVLARNYHFMRLFFWSSSFSSLRTILYARLTAVNPGKGYLIRCCLAKYTYQFIFGLYAVMVILPGVVQYLVEVTAHTHDSPELSNDLWLVSYTQASIGYGDDVPASGLSQASIVVSCLAGLFILGLLNSVSSSKLTLTLPESDFCSEVILGTIRQRQTAQSVVLLQSWWRLMRMRGMRMRHAPVILQFYSRLGTYRKLLVPRQQVRYGRFEYQVQSFDLSVRTRVERMSEYVRPAADMAEMVGARQMLDAVRQEYRILALTEKFRQYKLLVKSHKHLSTLRADASTEDISTRATSGASIARHAGAKQLAKQKNEAFQHVKARLLRRDV